jgi:ankyrin repeat protein
MIALESGSHLSPFSPAPDADEVVPPAFNIKAYSAQTETGAQDASEVLLEAIRKGDVPAVERILKDPPEGFDINAVDDTVGQTALHVAAFSSKSDEMIRLLVEVGRIDMAIRDAADFSAYQKAAHYSEKIDDPKLKRAAASLRDHMSAELVKAFADGNEDRAIELIMAIDPRGEFGWDVGGTFLFFAAMRGQAKVVKAIVEAIPRDQRAGFINKQMKDGNTALHAAAASGDRHLYDYLKDEGGDPNIRNRKGKRPQDGLTEGIEARGDNHNKPGALHLNPFRLWWDVVTVAFGRRYNPSTGPFRDEPEVELEDLPPVVSREEREAREIVGRIQATDIGRDFEFQWGPNRDGTQLTARLGPFTITPSNSDGTVIPRAEQGQFLVDYLRAIETILSTEPPGHIAVERVLRSGGTVHFMPQTEGLMPNTSAFTMADGGQMAIIRGPRQGGMDHRPNYRGHEWANRRNTPLDVIIFHELGHAGDMMLDETIGGHLHTILNANGIDAEYVEAERVGLEPFDDRERYPYSENAYREARGLLLRTFLNDEREIGSNGRWGNGNVRIPPPQEPEEYHAGFSPDGSSYSDDEDDGIWFKRDRIPGHEIAHATADEYDGMLNTLVVRMAEGVKDGRSLPLNDEGISDLFKDMVLYNLFHQVPHLLDEDDYLGKHNYLKTATRTAVEDLKNRIGSHFKDDPKRAREAMKAVKGYLDSKGGKGDAAFVAQQAWAEYQEVTTPPTRPEPDQPFQDYENTLNSLISDYTRRISLGGRTLPHFEGSYADRFKRLVTHFLERNFYQFDPAEDRDKWVKNAMNEAIEAIRGRLPGAYGDADSGKLALDIFDGYMNRHDGKKHARALAEEAFDAFAS